MTSQLGICRAFDIPTIFTLRVITAIYRWNHSNVFVVSKVRVRHRSFLPSKACIPILFCDWPNLSERVSQNATTF